jgi:hypothetical protein
LYDDVCASDFSNITNGRFSGLHRVFETENQKTEANLLSNHAAMIAIQCIISGLYTVFAINSNHLFEPVKPAASLILKLPGNSVKGMIIRRLWACCPDRI